MGRGVFIPADPIPVGQGMKLPILYILSGLPASGKSTIGKMLASWTGSAYLRIDTVEQGLRDLCNYHVQGEGYRLSYRIASDILRVGGSVVADSCNPWDLTRREWRGVAKAAGADFIDIEVVCSDKIEHRHRVEERKSDIENLRLPNWQEVLDRSYEEWAGERILLDTAGRDPEETFRFLLGELEPSQ